MAASGTTAIRAPTDDLKNHTTVLKQLKEASEIGQRQRGDPNNSYVKVGELTSAGIARFGNGTIQAPTAATGTGSTVDVQDSITGDGSSGTPLQLSGDSASPGNSKLYGTNGSGTKGWYAQPSGAVGVTITDGTHSITGATQVTFTGATVGGTTPNATVTVASGSAANVTPDTHPATELAPNDEFEFGTSIDTSGSRFSGATAWAWVNQGTSTAPVRSGSLVVLPQVSVNNSQRIVIMPVTGTTWEYTFKFGANNLITNSQSGCFGFYNSTSTKLTACGVFVSGTATGNSLVQRWSTPTTSPTTVGTGFCFPTASAQVVGGTTTSCILECYMKAGFDGTNLYWSYSPDGIVYQVVYTETPAAFIGSCTHIALGGDNNGSGGGTTAVQSAYIYDWFRKTI